MIYHNLYPGPNFLAGKVAAGTTRCGEHSDYGSLTFLFQDDLGGLEVRDKRGAWVRAKPVKDSMLVNMEDTPVSSPEMSKSG